MTEETKAIENDTPELNGSGEDAAVEEVEMFIIVEGKRYDASPPKMKLLRKMMRIQKMMKEDAKLFDEEKGIAVLYDLVRMIYDNDELTDEVLDETYISDTLNLSVIDNWVNKYFSKKNVMQAQEINAMRENRKNQ